MFKTKLIICLFLIPLFSYGQGFISVCNRTRVVRDAIMEQAHKINESIQCSDNELLALLIPQIQILLVYGHTPFLQPGDFSGFSSLRILRLKGLGLIELPQSIFSPLSSLESLDLRNNDLTALPQGIFSPLSSLEYLRIHFNPFDDDTKEWLEKSDLPIYSSMYERTFGW